MNKHDWVPIIAFTKTGWHWVWSAGHCVLISVLKHTLPDINIFKFKINDTNEKILYNYNNHKGHL